ncbi:MAG: hypothetical protein U0232_12470 [Thermomicrobiales bacterium]
MHTLAVDLRTTVDTIQWVSTGYCWRSATIPLVGRAQGAPSGQHWPGALTSSSCSASVLLQPAWNARARSPSACCKGRGRRHAAADVDAPSSRPRTAGNLGKSRRRRSACLRYRPILGPVLGGGVLYTPG